MSFLPVPLYVTFIATIQWVFFSTSFDKEGEFDEGGILLLPTVLVRGTHLGLMPRFSLLSDSCRILDVRRHL
jgi:hypothetical protein